MMNQLIDRLHADHLSLVILHEGRVATYEGHGVRTLYHILDNEPELLLDAKVAVAAAGHTAAQAMKEGGVVEVYADYISEQAYDTLHAADIKVTALHKVSHHDFLKIWERMGETLDDNRRPAATTPAQPADTPASLLTTSASLLTTSGELLMTPVKLLMTSAGSYHKSRAYVPYGTSPRIISHEPTYLPLRASQVPQRDRQGGLQPAAVHRLGQASDHPARRCPSGASRPHRCKQRRHCPRWAKCKEKLKKQPQNLAIAN